MQQEKNAQLDMKNVFIEKIQNQINELFQKDSPNYISDEELEQNFGDFLYVLSALMPMVMYNHLTGSKTTALEYNHIVNHLIVEDYLLMMRDSTIKAIDASDSIVNDTVNDTVNDEFATKSTDTKQANNIISF